MRILKHVMVLALLMMGMSSATGVTARAESKPQTEIEKNRAKACKNRVKKHKSEGWKSADKNVKLDDAVWNHLTNLEDSAYNYMELASVSYTNNTIEDGKISAAKNVRPTLMPMIKRELLSHYLSMNGMKPDDLSEEQRVEVNDVLDQLKIKIPAGTIKESYALSRKNDDGTFQLHSIYLIDVDKCKQATRLAIEQSEIFGDQAEQMQKFVEEKLFSRELSTE